MSHEREDGGAGRSGARSHPVGKRRGQYASGPRGCCSSAVTASDGLINGESQGAWKICLILLFPCLLQNLKVSSQTNFLSRAWWFPIFYFFEKNVQGSIPCCFSWPLSWPPGCFKSSCKKYSRVQKIGEDSEKSTWGAKQRLQLLYPKRYRCNQRDSFVLFLF